jgi:uncharacterized RDD family membrane protein YckC
LKSFDVATPEGVVLPFVVAPVSERILAFGLDLLLLGVGAIVSAFVGAVLSFSGLPGLGLALAFLSAFAWRNAYFVVGEAGRGGCTVGKRVAKLRVIAREGGPLTVEAVLARNLMRELEIYLPLSVLVFGRSLAPSIPGWMLVLATLWLFVFALLPLAGSLRLRCGDLVAGTVVVRLPRAALLADLAAVGGREIAFSREQLDIYGIHELQVLEDLLRLEAAGEAGEDVLQEVAAKIRAKIGWPGDVADMAAVGMVGGFGPRATWSRQEVLSFLQSFYRAQRARLEQKLLFGERQERKRDRPVSGR